jgi:hypothetical protein
LALLGTLSLPLSSLMCTQHRTWCHSISVFNQTLLCNPSLTSRLGLGLYGKFYRSHRAVLLVEGAHHACWLHRCDMGTFMTVAELDWLFSLKSLPRKLSQNRMLHSSVQFSSVCLLVVCLYVCLFICLFIYWLVGWLVGWFVVIFVYIIYIF